MNRNKTLILSIGIVLLIGLSAVALMLEENPGSEPGMGSNATFNDTPVEENTTPSEDNEASEQQEGNLNISSDDGGLGADGQALSEEELTQAANSILTDMSLEQITDMPTEGSLLEQSTLYFSYLSALEEGSEGPDKENAEWTASELYVWFTLAREEYNVQFDPNAYSKFIEEEQDREIKEEEQDPSQRLLFNVLENSYDETAKRRQQDIHYLQPFLWTLMEDEAVSRHGGGEDSDNTSSPALQAVEQAVFERMAQQYPNLVDN